MLKNTDGMADSVVPDETAPIKPHFEGLKYPWKHTNCCSLKQWKRDVEIKPYTLKFLYN